MSFTKALTRELIIARKYLHYRARESLSKYLSIISPPSIENSKFMQNLASLRAQRSRTKQAQMENLSWKEYLKETYNSSFSVQSAKMAMLESCAIAHAAEVAAEMNIDVPSINFVEETKANGSLAEESVSQKRTVTAYIEAPNANEEEFVEFVQRIRKECPVTRQMGDDIQFRRKY